MADMFEDRGIEMTDRQDKRTLDLDELLGQVSERLAAILDDPEKAYERAVHRKLGDAGSALLEDVTGPVSPIEVAERSLGVSESPSRYRYGLKSTGSLLLSWRKALTRRNLDEKADRVFGFEP
jgi:hypothetical protein